MSEAFGDNLDASSDHLRDKKDKTLSKEQVFAHLSRTLNAHNARIDSLSDLQGDQREKLKTDIKTFLLQSLHDTLYEKAIVNGQDTNVLGEYNASATDTNREPGLDSYEFSRYMDNLEEALRLIVELGGVDKFRKEIGVLNKGANEGATLDMDLLGDRNEKSPLTRQFTQWYGKNASNLTPEQIKDFTSAQFRGDKMKFAAGMAISLGTELGPEAVEIALNFVYDLGKAVLQLPEYLYFAFQYTRATTEVEKKEYSLKMKSRLDDNMALGLVALGYDGYVADTTSALLGANIHADAKGSRMQELIHSMGSPDTWTPAGIKEAMIGLLPVLRQVGKMGNKGSIAPLGSIEEPKRGTPPLNPNQETKGPNTEPLNTAPTVSQTQQAQPQNQQNPNLSGQPIATAGAIASENIHRINSGDISKDNPQTASLDAKLHSPETNVVKERKLQNGETVKFETGAYLEAYKEGLQKVGDLLRDTKDWVLMSSNAMYMNVKDYRMLPDDFDVVIRDKDFPTVYGNLQKEQEAGNIRDLELCSIDKTHKEHISDQETQQQLLGDGNLKIVFHIDTANGIPMEVEMFAEGKGKGLTQLGNIPRTIESFMLNGKEIKVSGIFDLADTYTINLMDELLKNSVDKFGEKAKDGARIYNLTHYLQKTGMEKPRDLLAKMDEVVAKYREHAGDKLAPGLEGIFGKLPKVTEMLEPIIKNYEEKQSDFDSPRKPSGLPEFQEFTETWNKEKEELHKLYVEVSKGEKPSPKRTQEIRKQLEGYAEKMQSIANKSLNNEDCQIKS